MSSLRQRNLPERDPMIPHLPARRGSTTRPGTARLVGLSTVTAVLLGTMLLSPAAAVPDHLDRSAARAAAPGLRTHQPADPASLPARISSQTLLSAVTRTLTTTTASSKYLGRYLSGLVVDAESGQVVWSHQAAVRRAPASTQKLLTAFTTLRTLSPSTRWTTRVVQSSQIPTRIYLVGAGDPALGSTQLKALAAQAAGVLRRQGWTTVRLYVDPGYFRAPTPTYGWKTSDLRSEVQQVRGLALAGYRGTDGAVAAGRVLAAYLRPHGIVASVKGHASTPAGSAIGSSQSPSVGYLVQRMLAVSSNDYAEFLLRQSTKAAGATTTSAAAAAFQRRVLAQAGVPLQGYLGYDGSGLSRANRMPPATLAAVLRRLLNEQADKDLVFAYGAMPRAGQTGTLANRFRARAQRCAAGQVMAKTGTLSGVNALAGLARGVDGRDRVFVLLDSGPTKSKAVRSALDTLATTVVGCRFV